MRNHLIGCIIMAVVSAASAQSVQYYDRGPGMDILLDDRGNYRYVIPLDPGRASGGHYVFDDDPRPPEIWLDLNRESPDENYDEDENE